MSNSINKYKDLALKVVYYTKKRQLGNKIFFATSKFQDVLDYFEKNLKDSQTFLKTSYFLNGKQLFPSDILLYYCTVDPNLRLVEEDMFLEIEELEHLDDASEPNYEKIIKPIINPFKLIVLNIKDGILQMVDFPKEKISELELDTINDNFAFCNSTDSLYISCGKNFWIISNDNYQIEKKEMPFFKEKHSMTYILSNNTVFIAGGDEDSFYYDINSKEFITWGKMNGISQQPALIQFGDFLYSFNSFNQSGIYFEKTKLTNPAKKWEKLIPQSGDQESGFFYNQFFGVSKCTGGNILFSGGVNNQLRTFIYNVKLNVLYITSSKDETILLADRNFYKIDHNFSIAIPKNIEKTHIIAIINKNSKTLNLIPFEQIGVKTRSNLLQFDNPRNRYPGNVTIQCRYMAIKDYENFLKSKEEQQNTKTKGGLGIFNRKEGRRFGDKLNGDSYKYQHRGKTPIALERISERIVEEENEDDEDLKKEPKSNSARKEKRSIDFGIKLDDVGNFNFVPQKKAEEKKNDNKNNDKNNIKTINNNEIIIQNQLQNENNENINLNNKNKIINSNIDINVDYDDDEKENNNINNSHPDIESKEILNSKMTNNEIKQSNIQDSDKKEKNQNIIMEQKKEDNKEIKEENQSEKEINKGINKKSKKARKVKHKKININLEKNEDEKNSDLNSSNVSSNPPSSLNDNTPISKNNNNASNNSQGDNRNINNINNNIDLNNKNSVNKNTKDLNNKNEINKGIMSSSNSEKNNINIALNNNYSKTERGEKEEIKKTSSINDNIANFQQNKENKKINNNDIIKGNNYQKNINNIPNKNINCDVNNLNNNNYNNNIYNNNINNIEQKKIDNLSNNTNNRNIIKSFNTNPKENNNILKSNTNIVTSSINHKNKNYQTNINNNYSSNPFIDNSKYQNNVEKEPYHYKEELEPNYNKIIANKAKSKKSLKKIPQKKSYNPSTVIARQADIDNPQIMYESNQHNNDNKNNHNHSPNFNMISYKTSTYKQIKGKRIVQLGQNSNNLKMNSINNEIENLNFSEIPKNLKNIHKKDYTPDQKNNRNITPHRLNTLQTDGNIKNKNYTEIFIKHNNIKKSPNKLNKKIQGNNNINIITNNTINNISNTQRILKSGNKLSSQRNTSKEKIFKSINNNFKNNDIIITKEGKKYVLTKNFKVQKDKIENDMSQRRNDNKFYFNNNNMNKISDSVNINK